MEADYKFTRMDEDEELEEQSWSDGEVLNDPAQSTENTEEQLHSPPTMMPDADLASKEGSSSPVLARRYLLRQNRRPPERLNM